MKTAVIIGSTGLLGSLLVEKLTQDGIYGQIIAIYRNKIENSSWFSHPKVRTLLFDFKDWSNLDLQLKSFVGTSPAVFFCCLGSTMKQAGSQKNFKQVDLDYVVRFSQLARSSRAEQLLVVSAVGANRCSSTFYNRIKGEMEDAVQKEFSGNLHFLRPSLLLGDRHDFRFGERVAILLAPLYTWLILGRYKNYQPVPAKKVVRALLLISGKKITAGRFFENTQILAV